MKAGRRIRARDRADGLSNGGWSQCCFGRETFRRITSTITHFTKLHPKPLLDLLPPQLAHHIGTSSVSLASCLTFRLSRDSLTARKLPPVLDTADLPHNGRTRWSDSHLQACACWRWWNRKGQYTPRLLKFSISTVESSQSEPFAGHPNKSKILLLFVSQATFKSRTLTLPPTRPPSSSDILLESSRRSTSPPLVLRSTL